MRKSTRNIISLLLTIIYLLIIVSPLVILAMQSAVMHTVVGECSGDCRIDGCSLERSAANACCCAQKKLSARKGLSAGCGEKSTFQACAPVKAATCCPLQTGNADESRYVYGTHPEQSSVAIISSRPCGSGKQLALLSIESAQHVPFFFIAAIPSPVQGVFTFDTPELMTSRYGEPPDPPPIISPVV